MVFIISIIPIQILTVLVIMTILPQEQYVSTINSFIPIKSFSSYVLSTAASGAYLFVLLAGLLKLIKSDDNSVASLISVLLFSFITLALFDLPKISTVMFTAAGISLIFNLMSSSYDMAFRDELTGLLGRRALNDRLKGLGRRFAIAMMDVDHFKKFNDTYGHDIGDDVLKMVAKQINTIKGGGTAYRYGGEEFCIVFPGKSAKECVPFLELVRISIENYQMELRNFEHRPKSQKQGKERRGRRDKKRGNEFVSVTISIGVAERNEQNALLENVLKAADDALYEAKESGRNCIKLVSSND